MDFGMNNSEIASELGINYNTLKKYCTIIYSKLGTSNRHLAVKLGLAKLPRSINLKNSRRSQFCQPPLGGSNQSKVLLN